MNSLAFLSLWITRSGCIICIVMMYYYSQIDDYSVWVEALANYRGDDIGRKVPMNEEREVRREEVEGD